MGMLLALILLMPLLPSPASAQSAPATLPPLGMSMESVKALQAAGAAPRYGSFWVGPWVANSGWNGLDNALRTGIATGTTPVVYWYYWGDSSSPSCVENGCDNRTKAQWFEMTTTLTQHIQKEMGGREVIVVLENEFNKGGITDPAYAPTFDGYMERIAKELKTVDGVKIVIGFGAWGESAWGRFPKTIAQSDYIGFQLMRAQTRDTESQYRGASDRIAYLTSYNTKTFNKPSFLYDLALSSYPDASWEKIQAEELSDIFSILRSASSTGLHGVVYRTLRDNPNMDPKNYYGYAERHWGLHYASSIGGTKPSWEVWKAEATRSSTPPPPPAANVPGSFEAESLPATTGGRATDSRFSGGAGWNLWANGELRATTVSNAAATYNVTVTALGQRAGGVDPIMELRLNGATLARFDVASDRVAAYSAEVALPAGSSTLAVVYTNDAIVNGQDRNLLVDVLRVTLPNHAPTASFAVAADGLTATFDASASRDPEGAALTYAWTFGDGTTGNGVTATRTYETGGNYQVTLRVSDGVHGTTTTQTITLTQPNAGPNAAFQAKGDLLDFTFDASASSDADGDALTYSWSFGDGNSSAGRVVTHRYAAAGTYVVTLTVDDGQMSSRVLGNVNAVQPNRAPNASLEVAGRDLTWTFNASASTDADGDQLTYSWDFGDGITAIGRAISHVYATAGDFLVKLTVSDGKTTTTTTTTVTAKEPNRAPTAAFNVSGRDLTWTLDAGASSDPEGKPLSYAWNLGDGRNATGALVNITYAKTGNYTVTLTVSDGELAQNASRVVAAKEPNRAPTAVITVTGKDMTWRFNGSDSKDPDGDTLTYQWHLGDGRILGGRVVNITYATPGNYTVRLAVSDGQFTTNATYLATAKLPNREPSAAFTISGRDLGWNLDGRPSSDPEGAALTYAWNLGDGRTATGAIVNVTYAKAGNYTVTLTVSDGELAGNVSRTVSAKAPNRAPTAGFVVSGQNLAWTLDAGASSDPEGTPLTYAWNLGDGRTASGRIVNVTYDKTGNYTVTLTVSDGELTNAASRVVTAKQPNRAPTAAFTANGADFTFAFDASGSRDVDGDALTYSWNFGDGTSASGVRASKTYAKAGNFSVTLIVNDGQLTATATQVVRAVQPNRAPVASFGATTHNMSATFDASASSDADGDTLAYSWSFGDGSTGTGRSASRTYAMPGSYTVTLTVNDGRGLSATTTRTVTATLPAEPATLAFEAESFQRKDTGAVFNDQSASGGRGWNIWANGGIHQTVTPASAGRYVIAVDARGDYANGWPIMELRVDGVTVDSWTVGSSTWKRYATEVDLPAGASTVSVRFTNDWRTTGADRNLRVDAIEIAPAATPVAVEAESFARKDNGMAFNRADASGGKVWMLWANGGMSHTVHLASGGWILETTAVGDECMGRPEMDVLVDGIVVGTFEVPGGALGKYAVRVDFASTADHVVTVRFTNDAMSKDCDRNLRVDAIVLKPVYG